MNDFIMHFIKVCIAFTCIELLFTGHQIYKNEVRRKRLLDEIEAERREQKATYETWKKLMEADISRMEKLKNK